MIRKLSELKFHKLQKNQKMNIIQKFKKMTFDNTSHSIKIENC